MKIQTFQKRLCISELFWLLQLFKSQLPTNILNLLNLKFRCLDKLILVSKLFLSLVITRKNQKNIFSKSKVFKIWAFVFFASIQITVINVMILKFSFVKNIENFKDHLLKESIWNKTTFIKIQILYRGWIFFHPPFAMRK